MYSCRGRLRIPKLCCPLATRTYAHAAAGRLKPTQSSNSPRTGPQPSDTKPRRSQLDPMPKKPTQLSPKTQPSLRKQPKRQNQQSTAPKPPAKKKNPAPQLPVVEGPVRNDAYFAQSIPAGISKQDIKEPVSCLHNLHTSIFSVKPSPHYERVRVGGDGPIVNRTSFSFVVPMNGLTISAIGDDLNPKRAYHLACLDALYQLANAQLLAHGPVKLAAKASLLSDGSTISNDDAKGFISFYCRRYSFGKPDLSLEAFKGLWEATLSVNGRRIGIGSAVSKKIAEDACFADATAYIERCDPKLWVTYRDAAESGHDLGMAPSVPFNFSSDLNSDIRDLCFDIMGSSLYRSKATASAPLTSPQKARRFLGASLSEERLEKKSELLRNALAAYEQNPQMAAMRATREGLPVHTRMEEVLSHLERNDVTVLMAATGSGKTTQVPQLILDHFIKKGEGANCNVMCTQPRRLAAISVASRVANERGEPIGRTIGHHVRFEARPPQPDGSVTFCTTGIFLKFAQSQLDGTSNRLDNVTHVVVDEVHERDVDTDLLLVVLKRLMVLRKSEGKPLKVILMSATIDPTLFQEYFPDDTGRPADVISIPGRSFPVQQFFLDDFIGDIQISPMKWATQTDVTSKYLATELSSNAPPLQATEEASHATKKWDHDLEIPRPLVAATISYVMQKTDEGHCLVFLPGWDDIVGVQRLLLNPDRPLGINFSSENISLHLLHSSVPLAEQQAIFEPAAPGKRRVILATNIAETSVTIPDVVYVVDSARLKETRYNPHKHMSALVSAWVGKSNLFQRTGRAGRHRPGEYYGLLSRAHCEALDPYQTVEMKRVDLSNIVMHVKAMNFPDMEVEDVLAQTIEPPSTPNVSLAIQNLQASGALDAKKDLTSLGRVLLKLPIDVQLGRLVLYGSFFQCLDRSLTLAALLSNRDPFLAPMHVKTEARRIKNSWTPPHYKSDAIAALLGYESWWDLHSKGKWRAANQFCMDNFLSRPTFLMVAKVKDQILNSLTSLGVLELSGGGSSIPSRVIPPQLNTNGDNLPLLAALVTLALQPKVAVRGSARSYRIAREKGALIHPSSVNNQARKESKCLEQEGERQLIAYGESRANLTLTETKPQTYLAVTTRIDPLIYILFGAIKLESAPRGLDGDKWLPLVGNIRMMDDVLRLKSLIEACMLRVFEGIVYKNESKSPAQPSDSPETEWEDVPSNYYSLSQTETQELRFLTRDLVAILSRFALERGSERSLSASIEKAPSHPLSLLSAPRAFQPMISQTPIPTNTPKRNHLPW